MKTHLYAALPVVLLALAHAPGALAQTERATPLEAAPAASAAPASARPFQVAYLRLGVGTTFDSYKHYRCTRIALEYAPMLTRKIGLAGRLVGVVGTPSDSGPYGPWIYQLPNQNYKSGHAEVEALFYPFGNAKRVRFAVGAGGFAGYYKLNGFNSASLLDGNVVAYQLLSEQKVYGGYLASLNLDVALGPQQRWLVGLRVAQQKGSGGVTDVPSETLTLARRF
ncbi:hypothetical protein [Hymenobacter nivis]|uniref:DUF3575 domain-containing protein n=1 Tax=Hymenobacter nivis TaxID=1850093 RepID=A0A502H0R5_9BACT|nr:hypothetical protein [Hymenobacter nivis]TPG67000.1 hypothetical protein EAH73_04465 [Hymenobacter nivis]